MWTRTYRALVHSKYAERKFFPKKAFHEIAVHGGGGEQWSDHANKGVVSQKPFSSNLNTVNMKMFQNDGWIYTLR